MLPYQAQAYAADGSMMANGQLQYEPAVGTPAFSTPQQAGAEMAHGMVQPQEMMLPAEGTPQPQVEEEGAEDYPPAEATHEEVVADPATFQRCLRSVHLQLGISDKIPRVGGKELDLHMLYCNVTALQGCERVIARKQWRDAAESFHFPDTITSVSFSLRKAYVTFLWDFEQIYYFRCTKKVPPPVPNRIGENRSADSGSKKKRKQSSQSHWPSQEHLQQQQILQQQLMQQQHYAAQQQQHMHTEQNASTMSYVGLSKDAPTALTASYSVQGAAPEEGLVVGSSGDVFVEAQFDAGYFVTVKLGNHEFKGILYYPPPERTIPPEGYRKRSGTGRPSMGNPEIKRQKKGDPSAPKPNKTPFNFFAAEQRQRVKDANPNMSNTDISRKVGEMWHNASDAERMPYIQMSNEDKARYLEELRAYNERVAQEQQMYAAQAAASQPMQTDEHGNVVHPMGVGNGMGQQMGQDHMGQDHMGQMTHEQMTAEQMGHEQMTHEQMAQHQHQQQMAHDQMAHDQLAHDQLTHDQLTHDQLAHDQLTHDQLNHEHAHAAYQAQMAAQMQEQQAYAHHGQLAGQIGADGQVYGTHVDGQVVGQGMPVQYDHTQVAHNEHGVPVTMEGAPDQGQPQQ